MKVSVILCTYNRCESLAKALDSIALSTLPESVGWEVLVIDNNSNDRTRTVTEEFRGRHPGRFRYVFESRQGKSHALNTGIREARGDILVFTDDDVTVEPTWLQNLTASLDESERTGAAGRTLPEKTFVSPRWMSSDNRLWRGPLGLFDLGDKGQELAETPFGNNMAFRKEAFEKYSGFRTDLGPRPGNEMRSEDTEFCKRLLLAKEHLWYEPAAVVYHSTPDDRIQKAYFLAWWFDKGRADIREFGIPSGTKWFVAGVPLSMFRRLAVWAVRWMFAVDPSRRFANKINVWSVAGQTKECYGNAASKGKCASALQL